MCSPPIFSPPIFSPPTFSPPMFSPMFSPPFFSPMFSPSIFSPPMFIPPIFSPPMVPRKTPPLTRMMRFRERTQDQVRYPSSTLCIHYPHYIQNILCADGGLCFLRWGCFQIY